MGSGRLVVVHPRLHEVDAGEELVGAHHAVEVLARNVHETRQARTGADEDLPEAGIFEVLQGGRLADDEVLDELAAEPVDLADHVVDQRVGQAEFGNSVAQHAAEVVEGFEHRDRVAFDRQQIGVDQAGRTGTDHRDRGLFGPDPRRDVVLPLVLVDAVFFFLEPLALGQVPFELADLDRPAGHGADALALMLLRAHAAGDIRQRIEPLDQLQGQSLSLPCPMRLSSSGNVDGHRAAALDAAFGVETALFARTVFALLVAQHLEPDEEIDLAHRIAERAIAQIPRRDEFEIVLALFGRADIGVDEVPAGPILRKPFEHRIAVAQMLVDRRDEFALKLERNRPDEALQDRRSYRLRAAGGSTAPW